MRGWSIDVVVLVYLGRVFCLFCLVVRGFVQEMEEYVVPGRDCRISLSCP